jgi:hypothetical protein
MWKKIIGVVLANRVYNWFKSRSNSKNEMKNEIEMEIRNQNVNEDINGLKNKIDGR